MNTGPTNATIEEIKSDGTIEAVFEAVNADLFIKTGKTGGKKFLVKVNAGTAKPTLIALHL